MKFLENHQSKPENRSKKNGGGLLFLKKKSIMIHTVIGINHYPNISSIIAGE